MRLKIRFLTILMIFLTFSLTISSLALYGYLKQNLAERVESVISDWAEILYEKIVSNENKFRADPDSFVLTPRSREYPSNSLLIYLTDDKGQALAYSALLKAGEIPVELEQDDIFKDLKSPNGRIIKYYQRLIEKRGRTLGYIIVGVSVSGYYWAIDKLKIILILFILTTMFLLGFGIYSITTLNIVQNQKKFLSFASHELRIPLSVISGNAELGLRKKLSPAKYQSILSLIKSKSDWISRLVANLLLLYRSESGTEKLYKKQFNLAELIMEETMQLKERYPQKKIKINLPEDSMIYADPDQLKRLVTNLLDNAAKYTDKTGKISISLSKKSSQNFILEIKDNGIGIPKKMYNKIFNPYFRINPDQKEGVGLGLAICQWIVKAHQGRISVVSFAGQGSNFIVSLPVK